MKKRFRLFQKDHVMDDGKKYLPVPVNSFINPEIPSQFIPHILLWFGHFITEIDMLLHFTFRECVRYAK